MLPPTTKTNTVQTTLRILLGAFMLMAAFGHLGPQRMEFQAQVPNWVPMDKDIVVVLSGIVELLLGLAMVFGNRWKVWIGAFLAVFYVLIFPGNVSQYVHHRDAFGLDTDTKRLVRLFFQPVLILWALWSTGALKELIKEWKRRRA